VKVQAHHSIVFFGIDGKLRLYMGSNEQNKWALHRLELKVDIGSNNKQNKGPVITYKPLSQMG